MLISVEVPVFKGGWLQRCIDSILYQSSRNWKLSLLWDGGDEQSRRILEDLDRLGHPNITVHFAENRGIARARRFLSEHSEGDFILPVDDDDALPFNAIERLSEVAEQRPWSAVIRAQRVIIDEDGTVIDTPPWFPFEARHYQSGMVTDVYNHTHPYLIRRSAYDRTAGWEGFPDFGHAGEDCDIYLKLEEAGTIELLDEVLYYYRVHSERASLVLTDQAALEMWRRLADKTIERIALPLRRINDTQPFRYAPTGRSQPTTESTAIVRASDGGATLCNEEYRRTTQRFVCFVAAADDAADSDLLADPLVAMLEADADLVVSEHALLVRREVLNAAGGLDDGYERTAAAMTDLCLKARQRDFRCVFLARTGFAARGNDAVFDEPDSQRHASKWAAYPELAEDAD